MNGTGSSSDSLIEVAENQAAAERAPLLGTSIGEELEEVEQTTTEAARLPQQQGPQQQQQQKRARPSPYAICVPVFFTVILAAMVIGIVQQWLIVYLCQRFVYEDGSILDRIHQEYLPGLFNSYSILQLKPDWEQCRGISEIQATAARWGMASSLVSGIPALIVGPAYGLLSDRIGRKPLLLTGMMSGALMYCSYLSISYLNLGMWVLLLMGFITGCMGSFFIMMTACLSYFADTTNPSERAQVFVIGESSFFAGFAFGPLLGGILARKLTNGPVDVFLIALIGKTIVIIFTFFFLPESLVLKKKTTVGGIAPPAYSNIAAAVAVAGNSSTSAAASLSPLLSATEIPVDESFEQEQLQGTTIFSQISQSVKNIVTVFKEAMTPSFTFLMVGLMLMAAAGSGKSIFFFYVSYTFGWDAQDEGQFLLVMSISRICYMLVIYPLIKRMFTRLVSTKKGKAKFDLNLIRSGVLVACVCALLQALSSKGWYLYAITLVDGYGTLVNPTVQSLLSSSVPKSSQGLLFAGVTFSIQVLGILFGILFPTIWSSTVKTIPNAFLFVVSMFYFAAGCSFITGVSSKSVLLAREKADRLSPSPPDDDIEEDSFTNGSSP